MKISHECPLAILPQSRNFNEYDYALVHLFEQIPEYYEFYKESVSLGRHVLLDNSIFELGHAFDSDKFAEYVKELKPTEYIIPDVLEDALGTMDSALDFTEKYGDLPGKKIGVVQGKTYSDLVNCYQYMDEVIKVDKIALSFDLPYYYSTVSPHPNKWMGCALGRAQTIVRLLNEGIINTDKPHHLLGCSLPIEFMFYRDDKFDWIETIDTSSPIVHALMGVVYEPCGIIDKQSIKLVDLMHASVDERQVDAMNWNISVFKSYVKGMPK